MSLDPKLIQTRHEHALSLAKLDRTRSRPAANADLFEHTAKYIYDPENAWLGGNLQERKLLLKLCFDSPLVYHNRRGFRTPKLTRIFMALDAAEEGESYLADGVGFEPTVESPLRQFSRLEP